MPEPKLLNGVKLPVMLFSAVQTGLPQSTFKKYECNSQVFAPQQTAALLCNRPVATAFPPKVWLALSPQAEAREYLE
jgi:hypothetical protein